MTSLPPAARVVLGVLLRWGAMLAVAVLSMQGVVDPQYAVWALLALATVEHWVARQ